MRHLLILLIAFAGVLTACDGASDEALPTRVVIATLPADPSPTADQTPTSAPPAPVAGTPTAINDAPNDDAPTDTPSPTPDADGETDAPTPTPSNTITDTPTRPPTETPTETTEPQAVNLLAELALQVTIVLPTDLPPRTRAPVDLGAGMPAACQYDAPGVFGGVVAQYPTIGALVGCALGTPPNPRQLSGAVQTFERGTMLWLGEPSGGVIYVLYDDGRLARYDDTFDENTDPERGNLSAPSGLQEPIRGFGKLWRDNADIQNALGWAVAGETPYSVSVQGFTLGRMVHIGGRGVVYVLALPSGRWQSVPSG